MESIESQTTFESVSIYPLKWHFSTIQFLIACVDQHWRGQWWWWWRWRWWWCAVRRSLILFAESVAFAANISQGRHQNQSQRNKLMYISSASMRCNSNDWWIKKISAGCCHVSFYWYICLTRRRKRTTRTSHHYYLFNDCKFTFRYVFMRGTWDKCIEFFIILIIQIMARLQFQWIFNYFEQINRASKCPHLIVHRVQYNVM